MPTWLLPILTTLGSVALQMGMSLISKRFIRFAIIQALEYLVKKTATEEDNRLLEEAKKQWSKDDETK